MSNVIKQVNTEKTYKFKDTGVYVFLFPKSFRKDKIKKEVETKYSVKVDAVRTVVLPKKEKSFRGVKGYLTQYKKAYVKVAKGMRIDGIDNNVNKE